MTSKTTSSFALFLTLNLLFFVIASSCGTCPTPTPPKPKPKPCPTPPKPGPSPTPPKPGPSPSGKCPADTLKLGVCADVLGLINLNIGKAPKTPCCALLENLVDLEAAVCLCLAIKANILGINLNVPVDLSLLLNYCGKNVPTGFQCN